MLVTSLIETARGTYKDTSKSDLCSRDLALHDAYIALPFPLFARRDQAYLNSLVVQPPTGDLFVQGRVEASLRLYEVAFPCA